jgi:phospholipase C
VTSAEVGLDHMARGPLVIILVFLLLVSFRAVPASVNTATPIQHIVVLMQENHSFDNYFGTYPDANGTLQDPTVSRLQRVNGLPSHVCLPYQGSCDSPYLTTSQSPSNPLEGQLAYEMDYGNNATGFPASSGPQSMAYFDYHSLPGYWDYAEEYGLGDNYYAPVLGTTTPNRLILLAGDTPVSANYGPPPNIAYSETALGQLDSAGVSWGYYDYLQAYAGPADAYPLNYVSGIPSRALGNIKDISDLALELALGSGLPSVSFANSLGGQRLDEHPPSSPSEGQQWAISLVNQVMRSSYWPSTAIFITWDEGGGFYDHVVPPKMFTVDHGFAYPLLGLGQRVPLLVLSPYSKENFVSSLFLSHLSLLHFIEYNWNLPALDGLVAQSNLPLDFFDFSQAPRAPIILSPQTTYPLSLQDQSSKPLFGAWLQYGFILGAIILLAALYGRRKASFSRHGREELWPLPQEQMPESTGRRGSLTGGCTGETLA